MNNTQVPATIAPIISFVAGLLAAKFTFFDTATWIYIIGALVGLGTTIWAGIATRDKNLVDTVGKQEGVIVVAPADMANSLPANASVVSSSDVKVVSK